MGHRLMKSLEGSLVGVRMLMSVLKLVYVSDIGEVFPCLVFDSFQLAHPFE